MISPTVELGFIPRPWQDESYHRFRPFSILVVHRRAGKTVQAVMRLIDEALSQKKPCPRYAYIAPLLKQAKDIAWGYLKQYALKVPLAVVNESELWVQFPNRARIRIYGADNPNAFRGLYFDGVVIDEVAQVKREVWREILIPALADRQGWALFIGTPGGINLFSELYYAALSNSDWYAAKYTIYDTKVFTSDEIEQLKSSMSEREFRQEFLCDFLASSDDSLISIEDARAAGERSIREDEISFAPRILGIDVAWRGGDRCVIFPRQGLAAFKPLVEQGLPEKAFAIRIAHVIDKWHPAMVFIDTTGGYGGEVLSRLLDSGYKAQGIVFSWKASEERFINLRAEMWFKLADWIKTGSIPNDSGLIEELCAPRYSNDNAANRLQLESKDAVRERIGRSVDLADALALTWAMPVYGEMGARSGMPTRPGVGHALTEWDPLR